jgi:hypothetical protein
MRKLIRETGTFKGAVIDDTWEMSVQEDVGYTWY